MPSVAFVTASLSARAGGLSITVPSTVNALVDRGVEVQVYGLKDKALELDSLPYRGVPVCAVSSWPTPGLRVAPALDRALREDRVDVVHLHGLWLYPSIATLRWRLRTKRPVVISAHGMLDAWALTNSAWKKQIAMTLFERQNLQGAACIHALNRRELAAVRAIGLQTPVAVIPNGVDLPDVGRTLDAPECLAGEQRRVLLSLSRMHPKKGLSETIAAWARLHAEKASVADDWVLVLAGWDDGGHVSKLRQEATDLGVGASVRFVGPVFGSEKQRLFARADAFILASFSEGQPMAVLEAWSYGVPVLMTNACNLAEGFEHGAAIEIPTDPVTMASILADALADPALMALGAAGRRLVECNFSWSTVANDLAAVYSWITGAGPRPSCVDLP
jgi:glycosyltransferase involved in cell wall biosynthesis